ncbi:MAG: 2-oxo acid dehydrogenase subunit E2 [Pirellulales bacterium]|nr:2-oxo acid dehydrogenase subunit E2 [Pirellulales bacterium]
MNKIDIIVSEEQAEGTRFVLRTWLKSPGSAVSVDEPIAEIETDKVTMEVPAPSSGVLGDNLTEAGTEVEPGMIIGSIASGGSDNVADKSLEKESPVSPKPSPITSRGNVDSELRHSPSVQRLLEQHNCDPAVITGTGRGGRITRSDVLAHVEKLPRDPAPKKPQTADSLVSKGQKIPHDSMRLAIAEHMQRSVSIAPHVTAVFEVDFTKIIRDRELLKDEFRRQNTNLTYTAYFVAACVKAIHTVPAVNSRWHDDGLEVFSDINIGVGTSLGDKGLVVPVIHGAQNLSLQEIAERLSDITGRARSSKLRTKDMQGGTFTISNHGVSGSLFATPIIINQPQSAILGIGKLEKRAVVREVDGRDSIVICPMAYVSLTLDHRVLDAHQANSFLTKWVQTIEEWS